MQGGTESAHKLIEALIMRAVTKGTECKSSVAIWLPDILASMPQHYHDKFQELNIDLLVEVKVTWDFPEVAPWDEE